MPVLITALLLVVALITASSSLTKFTYDSNGCKQICVMNNASATRQFWNYSDITMQYGNPRDYRLYRRVGKGAYGEVYLGRSLLRQEDVIIKIYKIDKLNIASLNKEIVMLQSLCGHKHIVQVYDVVLDDFQRFPTIVLEFVNTTYYKDLYPLFTANDIKHYAQQFLQALAFTHSHGVMHMDLKPANMVIDHEKRILKLIDWGLARFYYPDDYQTKQGTYQYWAPEMFVRNRHFDYQVDMWAFGVIFGTWIFRRRSPFFYGGKGKDQLKQIGQVLGNDDLRIYVEEMGFDFNVDKFFKKHFKRMPLQAFVNARNRQYATPLALDFLNKILVYDPRKRLNATQALEHPYFQDMV